MRLEPALTPGGSQLRARVLSETLAIALVALVILWAVIVFYDNAHRGTTNGLWKSIDIGRWVENSPDRATDGGNLLYYPVVAAMVGVLPSALGTVWQRMAFVNAIFGAVVLGLTYLIALRLLESRRAAVSACLVQLSMAFFLLLATNNEDIMPGYVWFVAALACGVLFRDRTPLALVLMAQAVALSWLFHSSLQLPGLLSIAFAIAVAELDVRRALQRVALFLLALIPLPLVCSVLVGLPWLSALWSGKGLGSGWGGFSSNKILLMWSGIAQSVAGGENLSSIEQILSASYAIRMGVTILLLALVLVYWLREARRRIDSPTWRFASAALLAAFGAAEVMNLYIQPQDPQMQIQPMTWWPIAAACVYWQGARCSRWPRLHAVALPIATAGLFWLNLSVYVPARHSDSIALASVRQTAAAVQPQNTMFLLHGFEGLSTWLTVSWGRGAVWPNDVSERPVPHVFAFHAIYVASEATEFPQRSAEESAANTIRLVNRALHEGFAVIAPADLWFATDEEWVDWFGTISGPEKPRAIRAALQTHFTEAPMGTLGAFGEFVRVTAKARSREP